MELTEIINKFKIGALSLDESKSLLGSVKPQNVHEQTIKDFLLKEISEITEKAMNVLIVLNEFEVLENDAAALVELYEIPIKKDFVS